MTDDDAPIAYRDALEELERILEELETDDVDVDVLASKVERAAELLTVCRERIGSAQVQVERIVAELHDVTDE